MAEKIACQETSVEVTKEMTDRDYLNDCLATLKQITTNSCIAVTEMSNLKLRDEVYKFFENIEQLQRETYELAWNNGWYTLETAGQTKLSESVKTLNKRLQELNSEE